MTDLLDSVEVLAGRRSADERGWLHVALGGSQLPATARFGELYVVRGEAGVRRGDHLHRRMDEWFTVVDGAAELQLLDPATGARLTLTLAADRPQTVRVPAGLAHCLVGGPHGFVATAWATAEHDPGDSIPCSTAAE